MKKLIVGYKDGAARVFSVPDTFTIYPADTLGDPAPLRWRTDDGWEGWVDHEDLRSVVVMTDETEKTILGSPGVLRELGVATQTNDLEPLVLRMDPDPRPDDLELGREPTAEEAAEAEATVRRLLTLDRHLEAVGGDHPAGSEPDTA